jgi:GNAT superfamily N-acetyltransferase
MKEPSTTIRRATTDDAAAIAESHVASWRTTYPGIVDQSYIEGLSVSERAAAWSERLSATGPSAADIFVATVPDQGIVGFVSGGVIREPFAAFDAELHAIYLLKSFQRAGVGRRLMNEWADVALSRGLHAAVVRVLAANPACSFYERLGAERLRDTQLVIGGRPYPERWYGWNSLHDLTK